MKNSPTTYDEAEKTTAIHVPSESAIKRQLVIETLQHPLVLLPLAGCIMSAVYMVLLSPLFGGRLLVVAFLIISGAFATAVLAWLYLSRYPQVYAHKVHESMRLHDQDRDISERALADDLRDTLQEGFERVDSAEGSSAIGRIVEEYEQLLQALDTEVETSSLLLPNLSMLAYEAYRRGLSVLSDALDLMNVTQASDRDRIEQEIARLERDIEASAPADQENGRLAIKQEALDSYRQRFHTFDRLQLRVDQLLHQAGRCEESLYSARIEMAAIRAGMSETQVDSVIEALQATIHQAKEVQDELKRLGYWA